jgi:biotin carboxylase
MHKILVTAAGGIAGVNFTRAVDLDGEIEVIGTEQNEYHKIFANGIEMVSVPPANDPFYIKSINETVKKYNISFLHPQSTPELQTIVKRKNELRVKTFLPDVDVVLKDKFEQQDILKNSGVSVAKTYAVMDLQNLQSLEKLLRYPVWVRARKGVGGRLSNKCNSFDEVRLWIELCEKQGRAQVSDFLVQQFFTGRDIAWDSLWYDGKLIISYCRERLEYPFSKLTMSGITGTPTVARIIHDKKVNETAIKAVRVLCKRPHGCFSVDLKEDGNGTSNVTEVDSGKFHTTIGLWGYLAEKNLKLPWYFNMPRLYVRLGIGENIPIENEVDIYPENLFLMRNLDCGAWMSLGNQKEKII